MKAFEIPMVEIVYLNESNIVTASSCVCDKCTVCPPGSNTCTCYDFCSTDTIGSNESKSNLANTTSVVVTNGDSLVPASLDNVDF